MRYFFEKRSARVVRPQLRKPLGRGEMFLINSSSIRGRFAYSRSLSPRGNNRGIVDGLKHHTLPILKRMQIVRSPRVPHLPTRTRPARNSSIYVFKSPRSSSGAFVGSSNRTVYSRISICTHTARLAYVTDAQPLAGTLPPYTRLSSRLFID